MAAARRGDHDLCLFGSLGLLCFVLLAGWLALGSGDGLAAIVRVQITGAPVGGGGKEG